jgi:lipopolysaccharide transport system ATP-binding protein
MNDTLVTVDSVSKKFCRKLKRSLWYGIKDLSSELIGRTNRDNTLRKDEFWAVKNVSFELRRGDAVGLIGHNGAGKTTILRILNGLIKPDTGSIEVKGRMQALIALGAGFNPILTGRENIFINASVLGIPKAEINKRFDEIVNFSGIEEFIDSPVQSYSSGMVIRLGFAVAAHMDPDILIIDEVLAVGDITFRSKCLNRIGEMRRNGVSTVLVSHQMHDILRFSTKVIYLENGQIKMHGDPGDVVERYNYESALISKPDKANKNSDLVGSGKVKIKDIYIKNSLNQCVTSIKTGDTIYLEIEYEKMNNNVKEVKVDFKIFDRVGVLVQWNNELSHVRLNKLGKEGSIVIKLEYIRCNTESLVFFVSFWNHDRTELFDWKREIPLLVKGENRSIGRFLPNIDWRHIIGKH